MKKIKSITEAFSMQPETFIVNPIGKIPTQPEFAIRKILLETRVISNKEIDVYVGYNFIGGEIFMYLANSVNVRYF